MGTATSALRLGPPYPRPRLRPVGPILTPLLYIQEPAIIEYFSGQPINSITGPTIANRVNRFICREPLAFERNISYSMGSYFDFLDTGANKSNARDVQT